MLAGGRRPLGEARTQPCLRGAALLREGCRAERPAGAEARAVALVGAERPDALEPHEEGDHEEADQGKAFGLRSVRLSSQPRLSGGSEEK